MPRPKLLMLDLPFHEHSRSSDFMLELLGRRFDVAREYLSAQDDPACLAAVRKHKPDVLVLFQIDFSPAALTEANVPTVWVPMYDNINRQFDDRFVAAARMRECLFVLSRIHADQATFWNLPHHAAIYYPPMEPAPDFDVGNNRVLFWYRGPIQPADVAGALTSIPNLEVVIKHDPDPTHVHVRRDDGALAPHVVEVFEGFLPKAEYAALVGSCGLYVAPRKAEGIGLSFLEAIARGAAVLAYDAPTMNEYMSHGVDGWLFGDGRVAPIDAGSISTVRAASYERALKGRDAWLRGEDAVLDFVTGASKPNLASNSAPFKTGVVGALKRLRRRR
ncbi:MAG TPA: glycosyltransferase [Fimbriimonadaceae bacterium]|nr:glycosyltransferase [Fimbriimonadaceae bacterium]